MTLRDIVSLAEKIKKDNGTGDPAEICRNLGYHLLYQSLGSHETAIKGFVITVGGEMAITVNSDLPENIQKIIIAHELFHALEHCGMSLCGYSEWAMFNELSDMEKEANLFAAELLLEDADVAGALEYNGDFFAAAAALYVPAELFEYKLRLMRSKGFKIEEAPVIPHNNFLKDIKVG
ncbi:MAG: ImmA/IrrE family metallo-endopeptidase [Clostridia bacterium]|nr:ImmA/IrrE family metallo-endopeptidase [Clostridia bacterium]